MIVVLRLVRDTVEVRRRHRAALLEEEEGIVLQTQGHRDVGRRLDGMEEIGDRDPGIGIWTRTGRGRIRARGHGRGRFRQGREVVLQGRVEGLEEVVGRAEGEIVRREVELEGGGEGVRVTAVTAVIVVGVEVGVGDGTGGPGDEAGWYAERKGAGARERNNAVGALRLRRE